MSKPAEPWVPKSQEPSLDSKACSILTVLPPTLTHIITQWPAGLLVLCQLSKPYRSLFSSSCVWYMASLFSLLFYKNVLVTEPVVVMQKSQKTVCPQIHFLKCCSILQQQGRDQINHWRKDTDFLNVKRSTTWRVNVCLDWHCSLGSRIKYRKKCC